MDDFLNNGLTMRPFMANLRIVGDLNSSATQNETFRAVEFISEAHYSPTVKSIE